MTPEDIRQCQSDWESTEMADLSSVHLQSERLKIYHRWFAKMLDHLHGRDNKPWLEGVRTDDKAMRDIIG